MTKLICLTNGKITKVSDEDSDLLVLYSWYENKNGYVISRRKTDRLQCGYEDIFMHRLVNDTPKGMVTDHINRDKLDNQRTNLRAVDTATNAYNSKLRNDNSSGHKGVSWSRSSKRWRADIQVKGKQVSLGTFHTLEDAIHARREYELKKDLIC